MIFGTFDILHPGHLHFISEAKKKGDRLIAVVARDITTKKIKGAVPTYSEQERKKILESIREIDAVVLGDNKEYFAIVKKVSPEIICLGYDQHIVAEDLQKEMAHAKLQPEIIRIGPYFPDRFKSSFYKQKQFLVGTALIYNEEKKFLFSKRKDIHNQEANGKWELPGGIVEFEETPEETAVRETEEETGYHISIDHLVPSIVTNYWERKTRKVVVITYLAKIVGGSERLETDEIYTLCWMAAGELHASDCLPGVVETACAGAQLLVSSPPQHIRT